MAAITASMVKELRERTGAGMMECKKALSESGGDMESAIELLRMKGEAKAEKKAGRIAAEGVIGYYGSDDGRLAALAEVNCETDFVAKQDDLQGFANVIARRVAEESPPDVNALLALTVEPGGETVESRRTALVAALGENISVRRFVRFQADGAGIGSYLHGTRIGVLVEIAGADETLGRDLAMHVAASRPLCVGRDEVPSDLVEREKQIYAAQAADSGKPENIIEKMVEGRLSKWLKEITLLGQPFVKDPDQTVDKLLKSRGAEVRRFVRFEVGEGIEKKADDFAAEVMAQAKGA
jgi:elongation factor Ts